MKRFASIFFFIILTILAHAEKKRSVAVIYSRDVSRSFLKPISTYDVTCDDINFYYFDVKKTNSEADNYAECSSEVFDHFGSTPPEAIVVNSGVNYMVIKSLAEYWPDVRIVLVGEFDHITNAEYANDLHAREDVERTDIRRLRDFYNITLLQMPFYLKETFDFARLVKPSLRHAIYLGGEDYQSRELQIEMKHLVEANGVEFHAITAVDNSYDDLCNLYNTLGEENTAIFYQSLFTNRKTDLFRARVESAFPLFSLHYATPKGDSKIVYYTSYTLEDYEAELHKLLNEVLYANKEPRNIPPRALKATRKTVNVDAYYTFGYDKSLLTPDIERINIPPSIWDNPRVINGVACSVFVLILLIGYSIFSYFKKKQLQRAYKEIDRINHELEIARNKAQNDSSMKSIFLQNMGHDIRNPINAIVGFSQILSLPDGSLTDQEKEECAKYVENNSEMLLMLMEDILNIADVENGIYKIDKKPSPVNEICRASLKSVDSKRPCGVIMHFTSEVDDAYCLNTDPRRVQQILTNYLTNACKHTTHGEILLHFALNDTKDEAIFSVTDTGHGIPPEMANDIFERFKKLDQIDGHGLGLNICLTISDRLGGKVSLDTTYTDGARFLFTLPVEALPCE